MLISFIISEKTIIISEKIVVVENYKNRTFLLFRRIGLRALRNPRKSRFSEINE